MNGINKPLSISVAMLLLYGCASPLSQRQDIVRIPGKIANRIDMAAANASSASEGTTRAMYGAVGVLLAKKLGPQYYSYSVNNADGQNLTLLTKTDVPIGSCVNILVGQSMADRKYWYQGEADLEVRENCQ